MEFSNFSEWGLLVLRLVVGVVFLFYGLPKLKNLKLNAENFNMMGFRPGMFWGTFIALLEVFGGIALILGLWLGWIGLLFAGEMLVAAVWKKIKEGKGLVGGYAFDLVLMAASLALATAGGGLYGLF